MKALHHTKEYYQKLVDDKIRCHDGFWCISGKQWSNYQQTTTKLAKLVLAIANSGGGELIFGISQKRGCIENFEPVCNFAKSCDWLLHEIQAQIDKPIADLAISIVPLSDEKEVIIHFSIPINNGSPHQFSDGRFYRWQKAKCLVMNESEVRASYLRLSCSDVEFLGVSNANGIPILRNGKFTEMNFYPKFMVRNAGNLVERDYKIEIAFPTALFEESNQPLRSAFIRHEGIKSVFGQRGNYPIFQQEILTLIEAKLTVTAENIDVFLSEELTIYLYYSNGLKKHNIKLADTFTYNGRRLAKEDFAFEE